MTPADTIAAFIPTFRRPALLEQTLNSLLAQTTQSRFPIVIADNDADKQEGAALARKWGAENGCLDRLTIIVVPEKGLSQNRNAGLNAAFALAGVTAVAMIDDDSEAAAGWYAALERTISAHPADLYGGPTLYTFAISVPDRLSGADMFGVPYQVSGPVPRLRSSNNCIITRALFARFDGAPFDAAFGQSGGEDSYLFTRCQHLGLVSMWIADAEVNEVVPPDRCTEAWVLKRHRNSAANTARISRLLSGTGAIGSQVMAMLREAIVGALRFFSPNDVTRFVGRMRIAAVAGRMEGLLGHVPKH